MNLHQPDISDFQSAKLRCMKKEKTYGIDRPNEPNSAHELIRTKNIFSQRNRRISTSPKISLNSGSAAMTRWREQDEISHGFRKCPPANFWLTDLGLLAAADFYEVVQPFRSRTEMCKSGISGNYMYLQPKMNERTVVRVRKNFG